MINCVAANNQAILFILYKGTVLMCQLQILWLFPSKYMHICYISAFSVTSWKKSASLHKTVFLFSALGVEPLERLLTCQDH